MPKREKLNYLKNKRIEILNLIKPICESFSIKEYDYVIDEDTLSETLVLNGQRIGCSSNSMSATVEELVGYIFIKIYCKERYWYHKPQTINAITKFWLN